MTTDHKQAIAAELAYVKRKAVRLAKAAGLGHEVEDIASHVMLVALRSAGRFDGANHRGWLTEIIKGVIKNGRRHSSNSKTSRLERTGADGETRFVIEPSANASQEVTLLIRELDAALPRLPQQQAMLIRLITIDGGSLDEAARTLGIPIGTVKSRLSQGLAELRHQLDYGPRTSRAPCDGQPRRRQSRTARSAPEGLRPGVVPLSNAA